MTNLQFLMIHEDVINAAFGIHKSKNNVYNLSSDFISKHSNFGKILDNWFYFFEYKKSAMKEPNAPITNYAEKAKSLVEKWEEQNWITSDEKIAILSQINTLKKEDGVIYYEWLLFHEELMLVTQNGTTRKPLFKQSTQEDFKFFPFIIIDTDKTFNFEGVEYRKFGLRKNGYVVDSDGSLLTWEVIREPSVVVKPKEIYSINPLGKGYDYRKRNLIAITKEESAELEKYRKNSDLGLGQDIYIDYISTEQELVDLVHYLMDIKYLGSSKPSAQKWSTLVDKHKGLYGKW